MTAVSRSASPKAARGRRSYSLVTGAGLLGLIVVLAILAPWITPHDPLAHNLESILAPPSSDYLLGTDHLGRDVWTRLLYAARLDLLIGVGAVITPFVTGTLLGAVAGYYGGRIDLAVSAATDMLFAFPYYVLIIALVFSLGPGIPSIFIAMAIVAWVSYARIVRGEVLSARGQQYVMAAKTLGYSDLRIIVRHILPNVITQPVTYAMSDIVVIIVGVVTLSYLGLGVPPPTPDWGSMISSGQSYLTTQWQLSTIPGIAVVIVGLSFSLIGDGLTHRLRPE